MAAEHTEELTYVRTLCDGLTAAVRDNSTELNLHKLQLIARIRFVLSQAARWIGDLDVERSQSETEGSGKERRALLGELMALCQIEGFKWPR